MTDETTPDKSGDMESADAYAASAATDQDGRAANFLQFLYGMHLQALMHLGHVPNPIAGERKVDLPNARYSIDLLGILQEKTRGNLAEEEETYLRSSLYELRMAYVQAVQAAAAETPKRAAECDATGGETPAEEEASSAETGADPDPDTSGLGN